MHAVRESSALTNYYGARACRMCKQKCSSVGSGSITIMGVFRRGYNMSSDMDSKTMPEQNLLIAGFKV